MGCSNSSPVNDEKPTVVSVATASDAVTAAAATAVSSKFTAPLERVLVLRNSVTGAASFSNKGIEKAIATIKASFPNVVIVERDLAKNQIPYLTEETSEAIRASKVETDAQKAADALATELIEEIKSANLVIVGLPRYNFGVPTSFKTYLDYIARPKITFQYVDGKPQGLLPDVPVWNIMSAGGVYGEDYYNEWLNVVLPFIGLNSLSYFPIEGTGMGKGDEALAAFEAAIVEEVKKIPQPPAPVVEAAPAEEQKDDVPEVAPAVPAAEDAAVPAAEESAAPAAEESAPAVPAAEEAAPAAEETPAAEESAPTTEETPAVPAAEEAAPAAE